MLAFCQINQALIMSFIPEDLNHIAMRTLAHYDQNAQDFWEGTRDHDVSQNIDSMLKYRRTIRNETLDEYPNSSETLIITVDLVSEH